MSFVCRLLDFTHATGSEQVELDTCLLAEEPVQSLHREHGELPPEPPTLPQPVSMTSFNDIIQEESRVLGGMDSGRWSLRKPKKLKPGSIGNPGVRAAGERQREDTERVELSPKRALKLGGRGSEPAVSSACLPVPQLYLRWQNIRILSLETGKWL